MWESTAEIKNVSSLRVLNSSRMHFVRAYMPDCNQTVLEQAVLFRAKKTAKKGGGMMMVGVPTLSCPAVAMT